MLLASHLRKTFTSVTAVDDVSLAVRNGRILGLLGPNGAGKTTTIRMILNILRPDSGTVTYHGRPFSPAARSILGYLPEERGLYRKSRLLDTVIYFGELRGMKRPAAKEAAERWLRRFGLEERARGRLEELSKGNQQKVQFILSVVHDPELLILDEPFSGLDPVNQELMKEVLLELRLQGKALVFSTHQMEQAEEMSEDICLINRGTVVLEGTLGRVKEQFGRNAVRVEFAGDGSVLKTLDGVESVSLSAQSAEVTLKAGYDPQRFLRQIVDRLEVRAFRSVQPSLRSIFIDAVGRTA